MTALTITHHIAAPLEVIPAALGERARALTATIAALAVDGSVSYCVANSQLVDAHAALRELEAARTRLKKPITELGREIDKVVATVAEPLEVAKRSLQSRVVAYQRAETEKAERARREAEEKARQEREAAERERARLQAEADAKAKQEAAELAAVLGKPVEPTPAKVELPPAPKPAVIAPAPVLPKAAVQTVQVPVLVVSDAGALAAWLVANSRAHLVEFKMRDIKALHDAGVPVPGLTVEMHEQTRMTRGAA